MASQYNVSDSSSEGSDIYGAAVSQSIEARSFYGRSLRQRSPKKPEGQEPGTFSDSSPTTVDDSDDDKHYYPPAPSPSKDSTGHGSARSSSGTNRGLTRSRSGRAHRAARAVGSQAISDSDMFGSSDTSPNKPSGSSATNRGSRRARGSTTRSRSTRVPRSRTRGSGRHTVGM